MRFVYLSRPFNRLGFPILEALVRDGTFVPEAIALPAGPMGELEMNPRGLALEREHYLREVRRYGCQPLRSFDSIAGLGRDAGIEVRVIEDLNDHEVLEWLDRLKVDLLVLGGGWPQLLGGKLIDHVPLGAINTHPSILPAFRGTDVHRWQILAGVETSGVTIHYVDMRFDTGPILSQREFAVPHRATPQTLADLAGAVAAGVMPDVLRRIRAAEPGLAEAKAQSPDHARVSYRSKWPWESDEFLHLDWSKPAWAIERLVLASTQESYKYNGPFFRVREQKFIVRDARASDGRSPGRCGEVVSVDRMNVVVRCGELGECVALREIQPGTDEGWPRSPHRAKRMSGAEFVDVFDLGPRTILA